jgi:hypothetical protein
MKKDYISRRRLTAHKPRGMGRARPRIAGLRKRTVGRSVVKKIGDRIGTSDCKRVTTVDSTGSYDSRVLYTQNILAISKGTGIDERQRDIADLKGIKFTWALRALPNENDVKPWYAHIALVSNKEGHNSPTIIDWFRGTGGTRMINFSANLSGMDNYTRQINTDLYDVIFHKKIALAPHEGTSCNDWAPGGTKSYKWVKKYIKINRQLRWDESTTIPGNANLYLVYWVDSFDTPALYGSDTGVLGIQNRTELYFRDAKG